ncbi:hypothetical protein DB42_BH00040 [Neochlamydia sp. EPS4]|nr:hypothetical protein DB42_BH00040 [Neochlamydia sp. EPS4]
MVIAKLTEIPIKLQLKKIAIIFVYNCLVPISSILLHVLFLSYTF